MGGTLLEKYKPLWANYLVAYLKSYEKEGLPISFLTIQNEPKATQTWESCLYSAEEEADFIKKYLHPCFLKHHIQTKLLIWDHNKERLFLRAKKSFSYQNCSNLIAGAAFHWYSGDYFENIELIHQLYPSKLLIHTEGCTGYSHFKKSGEIIHAEIYAHDILNDLNAGCHGFIDWNVLLDYHGGPNHKQNYCNSPIMLNRTNTDYIRLLPYYYIGHFSKYIHPHAKRIAFSKFTDKIEVTAFENPDSTIIVVLLNRTNEALQYHLVLENQTFHDNLDSHSIVTFVLS